MKRLVHHQSFSRRNRARLNHELLLFLAILSLLHFTLDSDALGPSRSIFDPSCIIIETKDLNNTIEKYYPMALFYESRTKMATLTVALLFESMPELFSVSLLTCPL